MAGSSRRRRPWLACDERASATRTLRIDELSVRIDLFGIAPDEVDQIFGQFASDQRTATLKLSVVSCGDRFFLFEGERPLGSCGSNEWIPRLKAVLTEHYTASVRDAFLMHAAFLVRGNTGIL